MISDEHAMRFPLAGSAMLFSLFLLFKFLSKDLVNAVLTCYFFILGIIALSATMLPTIERFLPKRWNEDLIVWCVPYFRCFRKSEFLEWENLDSKELHLIDLPTDEPHGTIEASLSQILSKM